MRPLVDSVGNGTSTIVSIDSEEEIRKAKELSGGRDLQIAI
jgi:hypothetical protein